jgi:quercetin dioxygenase-like cupin family protein
VDQINFPRAAQFSRGFFRGFGDHEKCGTPEPFSARKNVRGACNPWQARIEWRPSEGPNQKNPQAGSEMKKTIVNPIFQDSVTFLQTSAETNGKATKLEVTLKAKGRNVLHCHAYPETFTAIDGDLGLENGKKERKILKPGESYVVESMAWHCFFNPTDREIRFGVLVEPANEKLEYFLRILYGMAADGLTDRKSRPKSIKHAAILLGMAEGKMAGLSFALMSPILKGIARKARARGEEQKLIDKYCV